MVTLPGHSAFTIESPYGMRAWGFLQLVLCATLDARRIKA